MSNEQLSVEQQRIYEQLVAAMQERAGLDPQQAARAADVAGEFAQQHLTEIMRAFVPGGGVIGGIGRLFGRGN